MHVVIIGWLFVIGTMALTLSSPVAAIALFAGVGLAPVALAAWLAARRRARPGATAPAAREPRQ